MPDSKKKLENKKETVYDACMLLHPFFLPILEQGNKSQDHALGFRAMML